MPELRDWVPERTINDKIVIRGRIFNDTETHGCHPFPDGTRVVTSAIESIQGNTLKTRNTIYRLA